MKDLLERSDPALGRHADKTRLRAKVEERIEASVPLHQPSPSHRRPWVYAVIGFAVVIGVAVPPLLRQETAPGIPPGLGTHGEYAGIETMTRLASGGVQTSAVDGDTIWVMTALANELQKVSAVSGDIEATYEIDGYVEGVIFGGGYVWLLSYDDGGEVLRFDPESGSVDMSIPIGGEPWFGADWFGDSLWVSNDQSQIVQISSEGEMIETTEGELKGEGLGYHWINNPDTGAITSLSDDGSRGDIVIPANPTVTDGSGIRSVAEAGGYLWLMDDDFPNGSAVTRYDPVTGDLQLVSMGPGLLGMGQFEDSLWVTSNTDHVIFEVEPNTGIVHRYPLPGKPGGVFEANGDLWVTLYHPGSLIRIDPNAGLVEAAEVVEGTSDDERLSCTGNAQAVGGTIEARRPTILLEPSDWIDYGSWSMIQAELGNQGYLVCSHGFLQDEASPEQRAADLDQALMTSGIPGPYLLVANDDGVHAARVFADGRDDIVGVVLVDPSPVGFQSFYDEIVPDLAGHPRWLDLDPEVSDSLGDFGDMPLVVVGYDPRVTYLSPEFIDFAGAAKANEINDYRENGLEFYAGLSTNSSRTLADGTASNYILWDQSDLVVDQILDVIARAGE